MQPEAVVAEEWGPKVVGPPPEIGDVNRFLRSGGGCHLEGVVGHFTQQRCRLHCKQRRQ